MFCPTCRDEFRSGFTRCGRCNVDLVHDLAQAARDEPEREAVPVQTLLKMADYCGFLTLDDARRAREQLREIQVHSEILIREVSAVEPGAGLTEEYWIRADASRLRDVAAVLEASPGAHPAAPAEAEAEAEADVDGFECGDCGHHVADEEKFCPNCGAGFEDD